jgi:hypothetical protein
MVTNLTGRQLTRHARAPLNSRFFRGHAALPANADSHQITTLSNVRLSDQVMWLDWDQTVTGIASQPFRLGKGSGS